MVTIKKVAELAGVSSTTVSHIINETRPVSEELRTRVKDAMSQLGYRPNRLARSLRRGQTKTLGMIVPDSNNPFFAEIARGVEDASFNHGYSVILCNSEADPEKERLYTELLIEKQIDGLLFVAAGISGDDLVDLLQHSSVPVVVTDREISGGNADSMGIDNLAGGRMATHYLLDLDHRRIACLGGPWNDTPSGLRVAGYQQALAERGVAVKPELLVRGDWGCESGRQCAVELLQLNSRPTAIFACNDMMAIGVLRGAYELGIAVPDELSVIGFDDISLASFVTPTLTTVNQPKYVTGIAAVDILLRRIADRDRPTLRQEFPLELVVRESTGSV